MRLSYLWYSLPSTAKLVWTRITFSKLTIAYFVFTLFHFIVQLAFQIKALAVNANAADFLYNVVMQGQATSDSLPLLRGDVISLCAWVPNNLDSASCSVVFDGTQTTNLAGLNVSYNLGGNPPIPVPEPPPQSTSLTVLAPSRQTPSPASILPSVTLVPNASIGFSKTLPTVTVFVLPTTKPTMSTSSKGDGDDDGDELDKRDGHLTKIFAFREGDETKVNVSGPTFSNRAVTLDRRCVLSLNWPVSELSNTKREDIVFIAFQFWLLGLSFVAVLNESIPHILASLLTHVLATAWGAFQISSTQNFHSTFNRIITRGACAGVPLLPGYWQSRGTAEITSLALNVFALLISSILTWKLVKLFGWQTFKRVGASLTINRLYKIVLVLSILIQLGFFFIAVSVSLWIDQLMNSPIGDLASFQTLYKATSIAALVLLVPWFLTGWFAVRKELRGPMFLFLFFSTLYLAGWGVMFFATTFKWTFITWRFFSVMASASVLLTVASLTLGIVCRYNFGKGLSRYLSGQHDLSEDGFPYNSGSDTEKVDFPSSEKSLSMNYEHVPIIVPAPAQMFTSTRGPRFFNRFAEPFEISLVNSLRGAGGRKPSVESGVSRSNSQSSNSSKGSISNYSESGHSRNDSQARRWVIE